jgi:acyl-CoA thioesterase
MVSRDAFSQWLGVEVLTVAPGRCRCRMRVRPEMVNGFGVAHGGIAFSFADSAFAFACNTQGRIAMSIENSISYPAPIHPGDVLSCTAEEESASGRLGFYSVRVTNHKEETVALFRGIAFRTSEEHPE